MEQHRVVKIDVLKHKADLKPKMYGVKITYITDKRYAMGGFVPNILETDLLVHLGTDHYGKDVFVLYRRNFVIPMLGKLHKEDIRETKY